MPNGLQQQPGLRIEERGLAWREAEEGRVKPVHAVDEAAPARRKRLSVARGREYLRAPVPAVRGHLPDGVAPLEQKLPERVDVGSTRQSSGHADHCNRLGLRVLCGSDGLGGCASGWSGHAGARTQFLQLRGEQPCGVVAKQVWCGNVNGELFRNYFGEVAHVQRVQTQNAERRIRCNLGCLHLQLSCQKVDDGWQYVTCR